MTHGRHGTRAAGHGTPDVRGRADPARMPRHTGSAEAPASPTPWVSTPQRRAGRPMRFALTGGLAALCQLTLLLVFTRHGWADEGANVVAFIIATQVNFVLSSLITWRDRLPRRGRPVLVGRRWLAYQGSTAAMAVVNLLTYTVARHAMPALAASAMGIAAGALGNFLLNDRLVFRPPAAGAATMLAPGGLG